MSKVRFDGEEGSIELERITAKKNWMSPEQCNKMGSTYMFDALHKYMGQEMYPDLPNEVNGNVAVKQLPVYAFLKTKIEGTNQYNRKYIGNFTVGADKGDKGYFGMNNELCKDTAIRLEGTDHIKGVGFNYPWEVNGVKNIRYSADKEALCIVTGADKTAWSAILEQSYCGNKKSEADIEAYLEQEFKPAFDCAYRANPLLVGVTMTLDEINADIDGFKALRRNSDDRQYSYCEFWIDGEYDLYYLNLERNRYEKNGVNLYDELSDEEKSLVDAAETLEEKNQVFINFRINRFKEEAPNYWHINDGLYQLSFLYTIAGKDNGEKNMYPYKLIPLSEGGRWRFFQDDLDSIKAKDNQGLDTAPYSVELHDFTDDKKNAYVFKGEDNAYFQALEMAYPERFQKMGKDMLQAMYDLSPKGTKTLDKLMGFFDEFFFSRAQDYFTKSAYNNDAELYEEAWDDKEYVASVDIHPLAQSTGDHYTADRAWLEKRMLYLMAKYGFGSYSNYEDSSLGIISVRTQVAQGFTLTPAIDSFPTILGGQAQISKADHRIKAGESIKLAAVGGGNTNTYIVGADWLSDIGDLKDLSIDPSSVVVLSVASKRLRRLKVGDENPEEVTSYLATLAVQKCDSMETVDARNLKTLVGTVDLSKCPRLLEALFGGTNTTGVVIAAGSKIEHLQLPDSVTAIDLRNTKFLENFEYGTLANLGFLRLENVPTLNAFAMLKEAYNSEGSQLKDIRLVGWTYNGDATDVDMIANLANDKDKDGNHHPYNGIDAEGTPTTGNPVLEGKLNIDGYVYEEAADVVRQQFPTIEFTPKGYYVRFQDPEVLRVLLDNGVGDGVGITNEAAEKVTSISNWFIGNTTIESFDEFEKFTGITTVGSYGWTGGGFNGCTSLRKVSLPPTATALCNACFYNTTMLEEIDGLENIKTIGHSSYGGATFYSSGIKEINLSSLTEIFGNSHFKYSKVEIVHSLGSITQLTGSTNSGNGLFIDCKELKKVVLPDGLTLIGHCCFQGCSSLSDINIPQSVEEIQTYAFNGTSSMNIDVVLPNLKTFTGTAIFKNSGIRSLDLRGSTVEVIPSSSNNYNGFCHGCINLKELYLNEALREIQTQAFYGCTNLEIEELNLPNLETLGQNVFYEVKIKKMILGKEGGSLTLPSASSSRQNYGNKSVLEEFTLLSTTKTIPESCFHGYSSLKRVLLDWSAITSIGNYAFANCTSLEIEELLLTNLTSLGTYAFNGVKIKRLDVRNISSIPSTDNGYAKSWGDQEVLEYIRVSDKITSLARNSFSGYTALKTIEGLISVTSTSIYTFTGCTSLSSISLDSVVTIGYECFNGCTSLENIYMPNVESIDGYAFRNTSKLGGDMVLDRLKSLGRNNFTSSAINSLVLPSIEGAIGVQCCTSCSNLKYILFGSNLTGIGGEGFRWLTSLESVVLLSTTPPSLGSYCFVDNSSTIFYVPDESVTSYREASGWSAYADRIRPISQLATDNPILYEEIAEYL